MVVFATTVLLIASLAIMLYYSRRILKEEALSNAAQTLEATIQHVDNILLSVEQASGNMYLNILPHLDKPEMIFTYCRQLVESNPSIAGCAIAFKPYYFENRKYFMAYAYRTQTDSLKVTDSPVIHSETFGNTPYTAQEWFSKPMKTCRALWLSTTVEGQTNNTAPFITFSLTFVGRDGKTVGVLGVDLSISELSHVILSAKPSPNSYSVLLDSDGSYILHPDSNKLLRQTVFTQSSSDHTVKEAGAAMLSGESGYKRFRMDGHDYYVFYKPFIRSAVPGRSLERLNWSAGIVYPKDDIYGDFRRLLLVVLAITVVGLLALLVACRTFVHTQLLPLRMLTKSAQRIADGHYNEPIPDSHQHDEIGLLQDNFQSMQHALSNHVNELEQLNATLQERAEGLRSAYERAHKADRMKTAFLHNMTNQMLEPAITIDQCVGELCNLNEDTEQQESDRLVSTIQQQGKTIAEVLNNLLDISLDDNKRKEEGYA